MASPFDNLFGPPVVSGPTGGGADADAVERTLRVLQRLENRDGNPGQMVESVDRQGRPRAALGLFGIMSGNLPEWSRAALGREVSVQEFLANPDLQRQIAGHRVGAMLQETGGDVRRVAAMWLGGPRGEANPTADRFGTTATRYADNFMRLYGQVGGPGPGPANIVTGALPGPATRTETRTMASPFDFLFGEPAILRQEREQQAGATRRTGMALDFQREEIERQQGLLRDANAEWRRIWSQFGSELAPPDPARLNEALRTFIMTPAFMNLGRENSTALFNIFRQVQTNPNAPFAAPAGSLIARDTPEGVRPEIMVPGPRAETSVDRARTEHLNNIMNEGRQARAQLQELEALIDPMTRVGAAFPGGTWRGLAVRLGIPIAAGDRATDIQVIQSILDGLTPLQRRGLPGAASDRDMATFRGRLPDLLRTAEGNQQILAFLIAQARSHVQAGEAAGRVFTNEATPVDGLLGAQRIDFNRVLEQTREELTRRFDEAASATFAGAHGIELSRIDQMTSVELERFTESLRLNPAFRGEIPPALARRIRRRARQIEEAGQ